MLQRPKERRVYTDEDVDEDEIEGRRKFSVDDKLTSPRYNSHFVKELRGDGENCLSLTDNDRIMLIG